MIIIIDYGVGNLGSIVNMFKKIGAKAEVSAHPDTIAQADKLVLPGVGAFDSCMRSLQQQHLVTLLEDKVLNKQTPILGLCVGMQLFTRCSEEGNLPGLGWIRADTVRFRFNSENKLKVPHMGWNYIDVKCDNPLLTHTDEQKNRFYFVHSYHPVCDNSENVLATATYGYEFTCALIHNNIFGTQFHPEKSHKYGMKLLKGFAEYQSHV
jgi:glutamine amidotransferase